MARLSTAVILTLMFSTALFQGAFACTDLCGLSLVTCKGRPYDKAGCVNALADCFHSAFKCHCPGGAATPKESSCLHAATVNTALVNAIDICGHPNPNVCDGQVQIFKTAINGCAC